MSSLKRHHTKRTEPQYPKCSISDESLARAGRPNREQWSEQMVRRCSGGPGAWRRENFLQFPWLRGEGVLILKVWKEARAWVPSKNLRFGLHLRPRNTQTTPESWIGTKHFQFLPKLVYKYRILLLLRFQDKYSSPLCYKCIFIDILAATW